MYNTIPYPDKQTGKQTDKQIKSYWSNCGMVFFTGGYGWGLTESCRTISLGKEDNVNIFLKEGKLNANVTLEQLQVLRIIQEYRENKKEEEHKDAKLKRRSME